jgi:hypothetical protein
MELLGDMGHVESHFGLFGDSVTIGPFGDSGNLWRKIGAHFVPNVPQPQKSFGMHLMELLGDVGHVESYFGMFGDSVSVSAR